MLISARSYAQTVAKSAEKLGVALPDQYFAHIDQARALAEAISTISSVRADQLTTAAIAALEAGRDHHTDKTVQHLFLDRTLASNGLEHIARDRANERFRDMLAECADEILDTWAEALEPHSAHLTTAAQAGLDLNRPDVVIAQGGEGMHQLHHAQVAVAAWTAATTGFIALATNAGLGYNRHTATLVLTSARRDELMPAFELARVERTDVDAWILARCGIRLDLANLGDFMARAATFEADHQAEREAENNAEKQRRGYARQ